MRRGRRLIVGPSSNHMPLLTRAVLDAATVLALPLASLAGTLLGFCSGLVPGLHMNNVAAALVAYPAFVLTLCSALSGEAGGDTKGLLVSALIVGTLVGHLFAEAVTSTYVGIPDGDVVSVLPAHGLARAGLGSLSIKSASEGSMWGILIGAVLLFPACLVMGRPVELYYRIDSLMGFVVLGFSALLICGNAGPLREWMLRPRRSAGSLVASSAVFLSAGLLGLAVLDSNYCYCRLPDFPWIAHEPLRKSSLLLPMFAGLFGLPGLILSIGARAPEMKVSGSVVTAVPRPTAREIAACVVGGAMVGWLPGMTPGSSAAACAPLSRAMPEGASVEGAVRFVWAYSAISAMGSVFALGAFFLLGRTRSGSMDAVGRFLASPGEAGALADCAEPMLALVVAALVVGLAGSHLLALLDRRLAAVQGVIRSRGASLSSMAFVCSLVAALTGTRGLLLMAAATALGLLTPIAGRRRVLLMGSLLLPIALDFFA